jgi:isoleucyl-tRNA synthetase
MVDIRTSSKEGFDVATLNNDFIILNTELTKELILEGIAREMVSKVQNLRKTTGFEITDRIHVTYESDTEVEEAVNTHKEFIMNETLALTLTSSKLDEEVLDLNGHDTKIKVEKAN